MVRSRGQGSATSLPEADASLEPVENSGSGQRWPLPAPREVHLAPDGGSAPDDGPAGADALGAAQFREPLQGELREVLYDHQRALREAVARHEAAMRLGTEAMLEALGKEFVGLLRSGAVPLLPQPAGRSEDQELWPPQPMAGHPGGAGEFEARSSRQGAQREAALQKRGSMASVDSKAFELADTDETMCSTSDVRPFRSRAKFMPSWLKGMRGSTDFDMPTRRDVLGSRSCDGSLQRSSLTSFDTVWSQMPARVSQLVESFVAVCSSQRDKPVRGGAIAGIVNSMAFNMLGNLVIFVNSALIVHAANLRVHEDADSTPLAIAEVAFTGWYVLEIALKLIVHRSSFFTGEDRGFNVIDLVLVISAVLEMSLWIFGVWGMIGLDSSFLRTVRVFKVAKVLRMFRALSMFNEIRLMMECVVQSMGSLFWAIALLAFLTSLFAILFVQSLGSALDQGNLTALETEALLVHFGSVQTAMFSLLQATSGGRDWMVMYEHLKPLGLLATAAFVFYIMLMMIAVMNIVASVYLDKALQVAKPTLENMMLDKHFQDLKDAKELTDLISEMDTEHNGVITFTDFMRYMKEERFRLHFDVRGLNVKDTTMFFKMLSSAGGTEDSVDLKAFVTGCMRLKGVASCMDLYTVSWEIKVLRAQQARFMEWAEENLAAPPAARSRGRAHARRPSE